MRIADLGLLSVTRSSLRSDRTAGLHQGLIHVSVSLGLAPLGSAYHSQFRRPRSRAAAPTLQASAVRGALVMEEGDAAWGGGGVRKRVTQPPGVPKTRRHYEEEDRRALK